MFDHSPVLLLLMFYYKSSVHDCTCISSVEQKNWIQSMDNYELYHYTTFFVYLCIIISIHWHKSSELESNAMILLNKSYVTRKKNIIYGQLFECQNYNTRLIQNIFIHTLIFINNNNHRVTYEEPSPLFIQFKSHNFFKILFRFDSVQFAYSSHTLFGNKIKEKNGVVRD